MTSRGGKNKDAKRLMTLYDCKKHGTKYSTVLNLLKERGLEGAITQLEAWGMRANTQPKPDRMEQLKAEGFDESYALEGTLGAIKVVCSQCEALVINRAATHERGCHNAKKKEHDADEAD